MSEIKIVSDNQECWNNFVIENNGSFLQSFEWGEIQKKLGNKIFRARVKEGSSISSQALVIEHKLRFFNKAYFYIPYGPCFKNENALKPLFQQIEDLAKKQGAIFLRIEPYSPANRFPTIVGNLLADCIRVQPQKTLVLDITKPEQDILQSFSKATRYSIRQAEANRVSAEFKNEYSPKFYNLLKQTSQKAKFKPHAESHYKAFFEINSNDFKPKMCLAKHQGKIIAASIMVLFGKTAVYLHAASDKTMSALQAPSFLMWEQIKLAKSMGCEVFDFWGVDEKKWPGVTSFKKSFGGEEVEYPQGKDIVFKKFWYKLYKTFKTCDMRSVGIKLQRSPEI